MNYLIFPAAWILFATLLVACGKRNDTVVCAKAPRLREGLIQKGMTVEQVEKLLGKPDRVEREKENNLMGWTYREPSEGLVDGLQIEEITAVFKGNIVLDVLTTYCRTSRGETSDGLSHEALPIKPIKSNSLGFYEVAEAPSENTFSLPESGTDFGSLNLKKDGAIVSPEVISADIQSLGNNWNVLITLAPQCAMDFATMTKRSIGKRVAIVAANKVISAPYVNEELPAGPVQISGNLTEQDAKEIVGKIMGK